MAAIKNDRDIALRASDFRLTTVGANIAATVTAGGAVASGFYRTKDDPNTTPASITLTVTKVGYVAPTYEWSYTTSLDPVNKVVISGAISSTLAILNSTFIAHCSTGTDVTYYCKITETGWTTSIASIALPYIKAANSLPSVSVGRIAFELVTTAADVSTLTGSGSDLRVSLSGVYIPYAASGANTWNVSAVPSNVTLGAASTVTTTVTNDTRRYADLTAVAAGNISASITYTFQVTDAQGVVSIIVAIQSITKSTVGAAGLKSITLTMFKWSASETLPAQSSTYSWTTGILTLGTTLTSAGWSTSQGTSTTSGQSLYAVTKTISVASAATSTTFSWNTADSAGAAGALGTMGYRQDGSIGLTGITGGASRIAFVVTTSSNIPTVTGAGSGDALPTNSPASVVAGKGWAATAYSGLAAGEYQYQVDGVYTKTGDSPSNIVTWGTPYLSNLKVGSLSAIVANIGTLTVANPGSISSRSYVTPGTASTAGFYLGYGGAGAYVFDIGNKSTGGKYLDWDGTNLSWVGGSISNGSTFSVSAAGAITATSGTIGGFTLAASQFYTGTKSTYASAAAGVYLGTDGIALGTSSPFKVDSNGALSATSGAIGGFTLAASQLYTGSKSSFASAAAGVYVGTDGIALGTSSPFKVDSNGAITSTSGTLSGFTLGATKFSSGKTTLSDASAGVYVGTDGMSLGVSNAFTVTSAGDLTAASVTATGLLKSGKASYADNTAGYIFDYNAGTPRFYIGTATNSLKWTGSALNIVGGVIDSTTLFDGTTTLSVFLSGKIAKNAAYVLGASSEFTTANYNSTTAGTGGLTFTTNGILGRKRNAGNTGWDNTLVLDTNGNVTVAGAIVATSGTIGSFTIGTYLTTGGKAAYNDVTAGVHIGSDGIGLGSTFSVSAAGALIASSATITGSVTSTSGAIGGFILSTGQLYTGTKSTFASAAAGVYLGTDGIALGTSSPFKVDSNGALSATSGAIGGFTLSSTSLVTSAKGAYNDGAAGVYVGATGIGLGANFFVSAAGAVTAKSVSVAGAMTFSAATNCYVGSAAYGTAGCFMGYVVSGTYFGYATGGHATSGMKFAIGNPAGKYMVYDGTDVITKGGKITADYIYANGSTNAPDGTHASAITAVAATSGTAIYASSNVTGTPAVQVLNTTAGAGLSATNSSSGTALEGISSGTGTAITGQANSGAARAGLFTYNSGTMRADLATSTAAVDLVAGGIHFNAGSASADVNTLDAYLESTWTPTFTCGGGTATLGGATYASYTKIGNRVMFNLIAVVSATSSPSGALIISLPIATSANNYVACDVHMDSLVSSCTGAPQANIGPSSSAISLNTYAAGAVTNNVASNLQTGSVIMISGQYRI